MARTEHNHDDYGSWNRDAQSPLRERCESSSESGGPVSDCSDDTLMLPGGGPGDDPDRLDWWYPPIWEMHEMYYFASFPGQGDVEVHHANDDDSGNDDGLDIMSEPNLKRSRVE